MAKIMAKSSYLFLDQVLGRGNLDGKEAGGSFDFEEPSSEKEYQDSFEYALLYKS